MDTKGEHAPGRAGREGIISIGGVELSPGADWTRDARGSISLEKAGLRRLRLHLLAAEDPVVASAAMLEQALLLEALADEAFESPHWRGSLFQTIPLRMTGPLAELCRAAMEARLLSGPPEIARRAAKILVRLLPDVRSFTDQRMLLHCHFLSRSLTARKYGQYVKERLLLAGAAEYLVMRNGLEAFVAEFRPRIAAAGWAEAEFLAAIELLAATIDRHGGKAMGVPRSRVMEVEPDGSLVAILHDHFRTPAGNFRRFDRLVKARLDAAGNPLEVMRGHRLLRDGIAEFLEANPNSREVDGARMEALEKRLELLRDRRIADFDARPGLLVGDEPGA